MELFHAKDMYELGESAVREELDLSRLRIVNMSARPKPAENLVPPYILPLLLERDRFIVRSGSELAALADGPPIRPYWDPSLVRSPAKMRQSLHAIHEVGLLGFRHHAKAFASAFFIRKKNGNQRVIIDGKQANACHREPPKSLMATPSACAAFDFTENELWGGIALPSQHAPAERSPAEACPPPCVYGASVDLSDGFYQFLAQKVASWFCFDFGVAADEFGVSEIWDDATRAMVPVAPDTPLFPAFLGMPMGWKWALYIRMSFCHRRCCKSHCAGDGGQPRR